VRAGAVAAAALARGDRATALDRAAWAADGLGTVLGAALAHRELQPDRPATALRAAVPAPAVHPLAARRPPRPSRRPILGAVLLYHRVAALPDDPLGLAVAPHRFAEQLAALRRHWRPVGLDALLAGEGGPHAVALTFDDGYHDNLVAAAPALEAAGVTATLFASTGHVATGEGFWWDEVTQLLATAATGAVLALELPEGRRAWAPRDAAQRATVAAHVRGALQTRDAVTIADALAGLRAWAGAASGPPPERDRPLTVEELRALAGSPAFTVAAHGRTHLSLAHAPPAIRTAELAGSADDLARWLGARPASVAYPFGVPGVDVDAATRAAAAAAGYAWGVLNHPGLVRAGGDPYAVPRLAVPDLDGPAFARWLDAILPH
jgi:peptidoglycan/xylan/chitin deacetylase (PgdA/CDA1 family)